MNQDFKAIKEVENLLEDYIEATYNADIDRLKNVIFHKNASMYGYFGDDVVAGTPQSFFDDLASKNPMAEDKVDLKSVIENIQVTGNIATATLAFDGFFGVVTFRDYYHLIKENGQWYIVAKTFTTI